VNLETCHVLSLQEKHLGSSDTTKTERIIRVIFCNIIVETPKVERCTKNVPTGHEERIATQTNVFKQASKKIMRHVQVLSVKN
jgi:hypothetical protein